MKEVIKRLQGFAADAKQEQPHFIHPKIRDAETTESIDANMICFVFCGESGC